MIVRTGVTAHALDRCLKINRAVKQYIFRSHTTNIRLMTTTSRTVDIEDPYKTNGDVSCSTRCCRSTARHVECGKYRTTQEIIIFCVCSKFMTTACRDVEM